VKQMIAVAVMVGAWTLMPARTAGQTAGLQPERYSAWAVSMGTIAPGANQTVDFWVDRWSTPEEREHLITTMVEKGPDALLRALQKMKPAGRMRVLNWTGPDPHNARLGWDIRYAWQQPLPEGGRRIFLAFDRYIGFAEARNQPRTMDYPFTLVEVRLDKDGKGIGKWAVATKVRFDKQKKVMEIENYGSEPVRLQNVKASPKK
jgi:hypothetical protein